MGVTLLIRGPRSVELTEAGRVMQEEGVKLLEYIEQLKKRVQTAGRGDYGHLAGHLHPRLCAGAD